jgi:hypothetical protein
MRFLFALPQGGGTVQGFYFNAAGTRVSEPDEHGQYSWTGTVPAGGTVNVDAHYSVTGAGGYSYVLGSERRRIGDFHMVATTPQQPQYQKTGIYPTHISRGQSEWKLKDVLTSQSIALVFPRADLQGALLDKTLSLLPLLVVVFATGAFLVAPGRAFWGVIAFGLSLASIPVLSAYLLPAFATVIGSVLALVSAGLMLDSRKGWWISLLCAILCCAFLTAEHGALVAWIIAAAVLIALSSRARSRRPVPAVE